MNFDSLLMPPPPPLVPLPDLDLLQQEHTEKRRRLDRKAQLARDARLAKKNKLNALEQENSLLKARVAELERAVANSSTVTHVGAPGDPLLVLSGAISALAGNPTIRLVMWTQRYKQAEFFASTIAAPVMGIETTEGLVEALRNAKTYKTGSSEAIVAAASFVLQFTPEQRQRLDEWCAVYAPVVCKINLE